MTWTNHHNTSNLMSILIKSFIKIKPHMDEITVNFAF